MTASFPRGNLKTQLPVDAQGTAIPLMPYRDVAHAVTVSSTASSRNATAISDDTSIVTVTATVDVYMRAGTATVVADATATDGASELIIGGSKIDLVLPEGTRHLAFRAQDASGLVVISERALP